ncbi:MAG: uncharacterized protein QG589_166 [Patescibacteria group bacterium]|jgi:uncharacterized membrane protein (UPF0127 family)|nr:uncharacterized protein [Patescibacteria group bacterium]
MKYVRTLIVVVIGVCIIGYISYLAFSGPIYKTVWMGSKQFSVEVAHTDELRTFGLGGRTGLPANGGMLFIFDVPGDYGFWMKDMRIPIDMIWIDDVHHVTHTESNVLPSTYPTIFHSPKSSRYVLEVNAGEVGRLGVKVGDFITFSEI